MCSCETLLPQTEVSRGGTGSAALRVSWIVSPRRCSPRALKVGGASSPSWGGGGGGGGASSLDDVRVLPLSEEQEVDLNPEWSHLLRLRGLLLCRVPRVPIVHTFCSGRSLLVRGRRGAEHAAYQRRRGRRRPPLRRDSPKGVAVAEVGGQGGRVVVVADDLAVGRGRAVRLLVPRLLVPRQHLLGLLHADARVDARGRGL